MRPNHTAAIAAIEPILAAAEAEARDAGTLEAYSLPCRLAWTLREAVALLAEAGAGDEGRAGE